MTRGTQDIHGQPCPHCGAAAGADGQAHRVVDSRIADGGYRLRRRECLVCHKRWTMYEITEADMAVLKKATKILPIIGNQLLKLAERIIMEGRDV